VSSSFLFENSLRLKPCRILPLLQKKPSIPTHLYLLSFILYQKM
jgi:hypothetical protein